MMSWAVFDPAAVAQAATQPAPVGMEFEFRPNPPRVKSGGSWRSLCKVVDCPRIGHKDGMCSAHYNLSNDKEFYSGTRSKNIRLDSGLRSMSGIASYALRFNNWEDLATKDPSRAAVQYVLNTDLHAANIDTSNRTHMPITAWSKVFSAGQEPTNGYINNPRGFQKVVGLTDYYGRRTGILVKGEHLDYVADNLNEEDAYPRLKRGLQNPNFDLSVWNQMQAKAVDEEESPWQGILD